MWPRERRGGGDASQLRERKYAGRACRALGEAKPPQHCRSRERRSRRGEQRTGGDGLTRLRAS